MTARFTGAPEEGQYTIWLRIFLPSFSRVVQTVKKKSVKHIDDRFWRRKCKITYIRHMSINRTKTTERGMKT